MSPTPPPSPLSRRRFIGGAAAAASLLMLPRRSLGQGAAPAKKLGVALLGLGRYSKYELAPALLETRHCRLSGVVTGDPAKGQEWSRHYGFPSKNVYTYQTMDQLAGNPDIDVVYVVTPNQVHAENCIAAARAGKHVICEKPMATSVADCDRIIAACKAAQVRLFVGYRLHYEPHTAELCRLAREKVFGPFMKMEGANGFVMDGDSRAATDWRLNKKLAGGGPLMDMGVYVIQAACMAKAEEAPVAVTAAFGKVTLPEVFSEVEQSIHWTMEFADGAVASLRSGYDERVSRFRADAPGGWARLEDPAFYYDEPFLTTSRGPANFPKVNHQVAQLDGMALELIEGRPSLAPGEMGRRDIAITEAIYAAAAGGGRVVVKA